MFWRWKRRYRDAVALCHATADESGRWKKLAGGRLERLRETIDRCVAAERDLKTAKAQLAADRAEGERLRQELRRARADYDGFLVHLDAEKRENADLTARLRTTQAGLDHATHCYEQAECDRRALARERDERPTRQQWNESLAMLCRMRDAYERMRRLVRDAADAILVESPDVIDLLNDPRTKEPANAGDPDPDHAPARAPYFDARCITALFADDSPDFIRFPGRSVEGEGEGPGAA